MGPQRTVLAKALPALVAVGLPARAASEASSDAAAASSAEAPKPAAPAETPRVGMSLGVAAGLGVLDAGCDDCPAATSAGFGGQLGLRLGEPLFVGLGFAVATGSPGTTTDDLIVVETRNDEVMFALAAMARVYAPAPFFFGGGAGVADYTPRDREATRGPFLLGNVGWEFVRLDANGTPVGLEVQARGTTAFIDGYQVTTLAALFGGTVMP